jgi:hypothetical protein
MKAYGGGGCIAPSFVDLGTGWEWIVSFMPRSLYHRGNSPLYPWDRRLGGPQGRSGRYEDDPSVVQPAVCRCTDCATAIPLLLGYVYLVADGQSTSSSLYRASLRGPWPNFILILSLETNTFLLLKGALPEERTDL